MNRPNISSRLMATAALLSSRWPAVESLPALFLMGLLLPAYTITGFDASAHVAEETLRASATVPRGIVNSVIVSGVMGWLLLCTLVLSMPDAAEGARQGPPNAAATTAAATAAAATAAAKSARPRRCA